jgi:acyl dehydratase
MSWISRFLKSLVGSFDFETFGGVFQSHSILTSTPTSLSNFSVIELFLLVLLKYPARKIGELTGLLSHLKYDAEKLCFTLPPCSVSATLSVSDEDLRRYYSAILASDETSLQDNENIPIFMLTPLTNPLLLHLLSKYASPILPLGSVNVRNRFEFIDIEACRNLRQYTGKVYAIATMGGPGALGRAVKRGVEFDITIVATVDGKPIFKQIFTVLQFLRHSYPIRNAETATAQKEVDASPGISDNETEILNVDFEAPARWARLCKDYNPIHVSYWAARLFGFQGKIAHGNLVVGMVAERYLRNQLTQGDVSRYLEVEFKRPMTVPLSLGVSVRGVLGSRDDVACNFDISSTNKGPENKVYIKGRTRLL